MAALFKVKISTEAKKVASDFFGPSVSEQTLALAVGAAPGAVVEFSVNKDGSLFANIKHEAIELQQRRISRNQQGEMEVRNLYFEKKPWGGSHTGLRSLLAQITGCQELGIKRISTYAAGTAFDRDFGYIGYYIWARLGFQADLTSEEIQSLPRYLASCRTLNEVMLRRGHRWWQEAGTAREMFFEVTPNSSMMQVFERYVTGLKKRGLLQE